jgi:hypothetical protein
MKNILTKIVVPTSYNFDAKHKGIPTPMFANDKHGDCVIAGRAHQTLRFERLEQKNTIKITDEDVLKEWRRENGNTENGLYVIESLKLWRKRGWTVNKKNYKIKAFAQVNPKDKEEIKNAIYLNVGIGIGMSMPDSWEKEWESGKPWADTSMYPDPYSGHYVYIVGYDPEYLTCITWGRKQKMTWGFFQKYVDESYAIIDALNAKKLNEEKINEFLADKSPVESLMPDI